MPDRRLVGPTVMLTGVPLLCRTLAGSLVDTTALMPLRAAAMMMTPPWTPLPALQVCVCSVAGAVQACCSAQRQHPHPVLTGSAALMASIHPACLRHPALCASTQYQCGIAAGRAACAQGYGCQAVILLFMCLQAV